MRTEEKAVRPAKFRHQIECGWGNERKDAAIVVFGKWPWAEVLERHKCWARGTSHTERIMVEVEWERQPIKRAEQWATDGWEERGRTKGRGENKREDPQCLFEGPIRTLHQEGARKNTFTFSAALKREAGLFTKCHLWIVFVWAHGGGRCTALFTPSLVDSGSSPAPAQ